MTQRHSAIPRTMCLIFHKEEILLIKAGEDIIASANREIREESGLKLTNTKLRGVIHVTNFFGKNIIMFITVSRSNIKKVVSNHEGELKWIKLSDIENIDTFADVKPIIDHIYKLKPNQILHGTSEFDGKGKLISLDLNSS